MSSGQVPQILTRVGDDSPIRSNGDLLERLDALGRTLLNELQFSPRGSLVYRFFDELGLEEIADVMGVSVRTVKRDWTRARTWLYTDMQATP